MKKKIRDLLIFLLFYIISYVIAFFVCRLSNNLYWKLFIFDITATFIIWIFSIIIKNSSLYDAYWSSTPGVLIIHLLLNSNSINIYNVIFSNVLLLWSLRLTMNWIVTFKGIDKEDWRYKKYRDENSPLIFHVINFFGIQMLPTILVFLAFIPAIKVIVDGTNAYSLIGSAIIFIGTLIEFLSDYTMHVFLEINGSSKVCQEGLWKYSRHPNYLGEILVWLGVFISFILTYSEQWYFVIGFILMVLLFEFISIPMMEKRQVKRRKAYVDYQQTTSRLLILPKR